VATSSAIAVIPAPATQLAITVPSTSPRALQRFLVTVKATDAKGNLDSNYSGSVTLSLAANPGNATLGGTLTVQAVNGVATFYVTLDKAASGYQLKATASGLTAATSSALTVKPAAIQLAATASWDGSNTGTSLRTMVPFSVTVKALDANGNLDPNYSGTVTLSLSKNPSNGTLGGTLTAQLVNGVATFTGLTLNKAGKYSIQAMTTGLPPKDVVISVLTAATHLAITTQPPSSLTQKEDLFTLVAMALDANGNIDPNFSGLVAARLSANPGNAQLYQPAVGLTFDGTVRVMAVNGVATFTGLAVTRPGVGLTIMVFGGGLPTVSSTPFTVLTTSTQLAITAQPPTYVKTGTSFSLTVTAKDVHGNPDPNYVGLVTISLAANPGNGMLGGTLTSRAVNGVAAFGDLTLNKPASGYLITASVPGLTSATSSAINALTAAPQLAITAQPPSSVKPG
ncbi:hypothetical protein ACYOEI_32990, partial [Singulisphaera rosea]